MQRRSAFVTDLMVLLGALVALALVLGALAWGLPRLGVSLGAAPAADTPAIAAGAAPATGDAQLPAARVPARSAQPRLALRHRKKARLNLCRPATARRASRARQAFRPRVRVRRAAAAQVAWRRARERRLRTRKPPPQFPQTHNRAVHLCKSLRLLRRTRPRTP